MRKAKEYVYLRVTTHQLYAFPRGSINNWAPEQVIQDWFYEFPLEMSHAARDSYRVGYSTRLISAEEVSEEEAMKGLVSDA